MTSRPRLATPEHRSEMVEQLVRAVGVPLPSTHPPQPAPTFFKEYDDGCTETVPMSQDFERLAITQVFVRLVCYLR